MTRREWLSLSAAAAMARPAFSAPAPASPVAVARCRSYGPELTTTLSKMFDQIGGLGKLVAGKTVAMKVNLTGGPSQRLAHVGAESAHWTHPAVIAATVHLMSKAGARRVRILESSWSTTEPIEETMYAANWDPSLILNAGGKVEMENTNFLGQGKRYHKFTPPNGGYMFKEYLLNHSYEDCDVFVSCAKLKEHITTGVTIAMKNLFGITPCTIYGDGAPVDEPSLVPKGGRSAVMHDGRRAPAKIAVPEHPGSPRQAGARIPRVVADLVAARPIHLSIVDGIETMSAGEGPWCPGVLPIKPDLLIVGLNPVCTDAVGTALMGYDPMADRGTPPFQISDSTLRLAEEHGVGTRDLKRIEVIGLPISEGRFEFAKYRAPMPAFMRRG
ncbi:MAG TPA: DUF362 domain-containing protein [Bryobacteraceae bacterium]|nr:DUF362 domain-containing protein [Bryobacteraceae bacterium]